MNINFIKTDNDLFDTVVRGSFIVELYKITDRSESIVKIIAYDTIRNTTEEIKKDLLKLDHVRIINASSDNDCFFFASYDLSAPPAVFVNIHKYYLHSHKDSVIYTFADNFDSLKKQAIRIFILPESNLIIQKKNNDRYELKLYNYESCSSFDIVEYNLVNNGIDTIILLTDSRLLIKTGFFHSDNESDMQEKNSTIEGIFITTIAKFYADISLYKEIIDMELVYSAFRTETISVPKISGDHIYFTVINYEKNSSVCIFYNRLTAEKISYEIPEFSYSDLNSAYVINNTPYVRISNKLRIDFINLKNAEIDISFYNEQFIGQINKIFICSKKSADRYLKRIYALDKLKIIYEGKIDITHFCCINNDYYIYTI